MLVSLSLIIRNMMISIHCFAISHCFGFSHLHQSSLHVTFPPVSLFQSIPSPKFCFMKQPHTGMKIYATLIAIVLRLARNRGRLLGNNTVCKFLVSKRVVLRETDKTWSQ